MWAIFFTIAIEQSRAAQASILMSASPEAVSTELSMQLQAVGLSEASNLAVSFEGFSPNVEVAQEDSGGRTLIISIVILVVLACAGGTGLMAWRWRQNKARSLEIAPRKTKCWPQTIHHSNKLAKAR